MGNTHENNKVKSHHCPLPWKQWKLQPDLQPPYKRVRETVPLPYKRSCWDTEVTLKLRILTQKKNFSGKEFPHRLQPKNRYLEPNRRKVENNLELNTGKDFLNRTLLTQTLISTINKWDLMKLKSFCMAKDPIIQTKRQLTEW